MKNPEAGGEVIRSNVGLHAERNLCPDARVLLAPALLLSAVVELAQGDTACSHAGHDWIARPGPMAWCIDLALEIDAFTRAFRSLKAFELIEVSKRMADADAGTPAVMLLRPTEAGYELAAAVAGGFLRRVLCASDGRPLLDENGSVMLSGS